MTTATTAHTGVTASHRTMFLAYKSRRNVAGWSAAAITRLASGPRTLVAGTSEYIHAARTSAKASVPCRVKTLSLRPVGRKNQAEHMRAALAATVMRFSNGGSSVRAICSRTASRMLVGSSTSVVSVMCHVVAGVAGSHNTRPVGG